MSAGRGDSAEARGEEHRGGDRRNKQALARITGGAAHGRGGTAARIRPPLGGHSFRHFSMMLPPYREVHLSPSATTARYRTRGRRGRVVAKRPLVLSFYLVLAVYPPLWTLHLYVTKRDNAPSERVVAHQWCVAPQSSCWPHCCTRLVRRRALGRSLTHRVVAPRCHRMCSV